MVYIKVISKLIAVKSAFSSGIFLCRINYNKNINYNKPTM